MNRKILINSTGSTLMMVMLAIGALSVSTFTVMKQLQTSKKSIKSIQIKKNQELIEYKVMALMADRNICTANFESKQPNSLHTEIKRENSVIFKTGNTYSNGTIKVTGISTSLVSPTEFVLTFSYEKRLTGQAQAQKINKKFKLIGALKSLDSSIDYCYLDDEDLIESAIDEALNKICNGPGVVGGSTNGECKILNFTEFDSEVPLSDPSCSTATGKGIGSYALDPNTGRFEFTCAPLILEVGSSNTECEFGLVYTDTNPGKFECFNLDDLIDEAPQTILENASCKIDMNATTKKYFLSCSGGTASSGSGGGSTGTPQWVYGAWGACSDDLACKQSRSKTCQDSVTNATLPNSSCPAMSGPTIRPCPIPNLCGGGGTYSGVWSNANVISCADPDSVNCHSVVTAYCQDTGGSNIDKSNCGSKPVEATGHNVGVSFVCFQTSSKECWIRPITCPTGAAQSACITP